MSTPGKRTGRVRYRGRICVLPDGSFAVRTSSVQCDDVRDLVPDDGIRRRAHHYEDDPVPLDVFELMSRPVGYRLIKGRNMLWDDD